MIENMTKTLTLQDIAAEDGTFAVVAMDQRNTLRRMYAKTGIEDVPEEELIAIKRDVITGLSPAASAILLDPTWGIPALQQIDRPRPGILVAAEPAKRPTYEGEPRAALDPELNGQWVRAQGGDALKFLIQVRPFRPHAPGTPDLVGEAVEVIAKVVADCRDAGVPSVIENLIYPLPGEQLTPDERADQIIEAARLLGDLKPDLLKLEYPGSPEACRRLANTISVPWAVLSAGVAFDEFTEVLKVSCDEGGASGFIAGRALWQETVGMDSLSRRAYLADEGLRRLEECVRAISGRARPWQEAIGR